MLGGLKIGDLVLITDVLTILNEKKKSLIGSVYKITKIDTSPFRFPYAVQTSEYGVVWVEGVEPSPLLLELV